MDTQTSIVSESKATRSRTSILYPNASLYFALAMIVTWIGFSQSYFGRLQQVTIYHHLHGATAGCWMLLLLVQPMLYKRKQFQLHRKLGRIATVILVPLLVIGGFKMMHSMLNSKAMYPPGVPYQLAYIDIVSIFLFASFIILSLKNARNIQLHARYMALTVLVILPPAITRLLFLLPWFHSFNGTLNGSFIAVEAIVLLLLADDKRSGRIRVPYIAGLILFLALHLSMNYAGNWNAWQVLMNNYAAI